MCDLRDTYKVKARSQISQGFYFFSILPGFTHSLENILKHLESSCQHFYFCLSVKLFLSPLTIYLVYNLQIGKLSFPMFTKPSEPYLANKTTGFCNLLLTLSLNWTIHLKFQSFWVLPQPKRVLTCKWHRNQRMV